MAGPVVSGRYSVTVSDSRSLIGSATASLVTCPPAGITTERPFPNPSRRSEPARTAALSPGRAMLAAATFSGDAPYWLDNRIRADDPEAVTRTTCRTVCPENPCSDQLGSKAGGRALHRGGPTGRPAVLVRSGPGRRLRGGGAHSDQTARGHAQHDDPAGPTLLHHHRFPPRLIPARS